MYKFSKGFFVGTDILLLVEKGLKSRARVTEFCQAIVNILSFSHLFDERFFFTLLLGMLLFH
ncbi:MAG: hypothetical protein GXP14_00160 [Gammaproteobacteria bacterium]|nr:hypothetical protein [Gammaproteobacteria bacterium]